MSHEKRTSKPAEGKGNVIVSVRVRPDAGSNGERSNADGEWMVDGRRSLVAYRGKEGGDYYYGTFVTSFHVVAANAMQITFLQHTIITRKCTIPLLRGSFGG